MLCADLGAADRKALQPALIYQSGGIIASRALKGGACAAIFQRLLFTAAGHIVLHCGTDRRFFGRGQRQHRLYNHAVPFLKNAVAVGKPQLCGRNGAVFALLIKEGHFSKDVPQLAAVGAGIHVNAAAEGTGNPVSPFNAGKRLLCGGTADADKRSPCPAAEEIALTGDGGKALAQLNDRTGNARIADQQIAAPSKDKRRLSRRTAERNGGLQLLPCVRAQQQCLSADAEGGAAAHELMLGKRDPCLMKLFQ